MSTNLRTEFALSCDRLRWSLNADDIAFSSTRDVNKDTKIFGHETAKEALRFAIESKTPYQNTFVRGLVGTGRKTLVMKELGDLQPKARRQHDFCYVHNFELSNCPSLIVLDKGYGKLFKGMVDKLTSYLVNDLKETINSTALRTARKNTEDDYNEKIQQRFEALDEKLKKEDLTLVTVGEGNQRQTIIAPLYEGNPLDQKMAQQLIADGKLPENYFDVLREKIAPYQDELVGVSLESAKIGEEMDMAIKQINIDFVRTQINEHSQIIREKFDEQSVLDFIDGLTEDFINNRLHNQGEEQLDLTQLYSVNIINRRHCDDNAPIVFESAPTEANLIGDIEPNANKPPHENIRAGSLLQADGGFLILEIDNAFWESGAWANLMRTLRTGLLNIATSNAQNAYASAVKPEAIELDVRVILIGSPQHFYMLNQMNPDFMDIFRILADMDTTLPRDNETFVQYAQVLKNAIKQDHLPDFHKSAIIELIEYGARMSGTGDEVSGRFRRIIDVAREAAYHAEKDNSELVHDTHIQSALACAKKRTYLPTERFYRLLKNKTINIHTEGLVTGQINGLAVTSNGVMSYGFPARITATTAPGKTGLIDIEGVASLSGQIHTKGIGILGGLMRHLVKPHHPLSFSASIAFEQSYGGIDGDSASGAEACCLMSALSGVPIDQGVAMTGAIDQFGNLQAIGGVNEKIEGFFDTCAYHGLTGTQGVIIPTSNAAELMLRDDIVSACRDDKFHIFAVDHVLDALAILTNQASQKSALFDDRRYEADSTLAKVVDTFSAYHNQSVNV